MHVRVPSAARALVAAAVLLVCAACGGRPGSPEELYADLAAFNGAGETGRIWDLLTPEAKEREIKVIDDERVFLRRNPDPTNDKIVKQFKCTREEFHTLPYTELYRRENLGNERAFLDAKVVDRQQDPRNPAVVVLTVKSPLGTKFLVHTQQLEDGWGLIQIVTLRE